MGAEDIARAARRRNAVAQRTLAVRRAQQRRFRIGLACAAVLHAALFVGVGTWSSPRQLGEPDASPDGIAVELVDAADLKSLNTVQMPPINTGSVAPPPQPHNRHSHRSNSPSHRQKRSLRRRRFPHRR